GPRNRTVPLPPAFAIPVVCAPCPNFTGSKYTGMTRTRKYMKSDGLANFVLGLGVGIGLGVLFAPRSGEETRGILKNKADEGADYLKRQTEDLRMKADGLAGKSREAINRQRDNLADAIAAGKHAYREKIDQMSPSQTA